MNDEAPLMSGEEYAHEHDSNDNIQQRSVRSHGSPWRMTYEHALAETRQDFTATSIIQLVLFAASLVIATQNFRLLGIVSCGIGLLGAFVGLGAMRAYRVLPPKKSGGYMLWIFLIMQIAGVFVSAAAAALTYRSIARYHKFCPQNENDPQRSVMSMDCPPMMTLGIAAAITPILFAAFLSGAIYSRRLQNLAEKFVNRGPRNYGSEYFQQSPL